MNDSRIEAQYLNRERGTNDQIRLTTILYRQERKRVMRRALTLLVVLLLTTQSSFSQTPGSGDITRATLDNGLRVVIVRDPLAPVVTVMQNYLVGANETPPGLPGMAHPGKGACGRRLRICTFGQRRRAPPPS